MSPDKNSRFVQGFVQANGLRIAYEEFGDPNDPAIVLVAGLFNQLVRWPVALCELLVARGYRVIRFDNRDIGLSDKMDGARAPGLLRLFLVSQFAVPVKTPYTLDDMAEDTIGLMDALNIQAAHIVGMSMGGMISQIVAARYPKRILSLTSIMSTSGVRGKGVPSIPVSLQMIKPVTKTRSALDNSVDIWRMIGSPAYPVSDEEARQILQAEQQRSNNPAAYMRQIAAIKAAPNRIELLRSIKVPVLIIHGKQDRLVPVSGGIDTAKYIPHAKLCLFEGMGHNLPKPLLAKFAELIARH
ncbi:MAG: alpha/beta hydrolase [Porticoccaceae bacterium]|nr:alpha/beta hydrolase [Porticoccaceae bacterium]